MEKQKVIKKLKSKVLQIDKQATVILYGSRARGDYNEDSDWDFLILTELPESKEIKEAFTNKIFEAELELEEPISTIIHNKSLWENYEVTPLYHNIQKEGLLV